MLTWTQNRTVYCSNTNEAQTTVYFYYRFMGLVIIQLVKEFQPAQFSPHLSILFSKIHFYIFSSVTRASKWSLHLRFTSQTFVCISQFSHVCVCKSHPPHHPSFNLVTFSTGSIHTSITLHDTKK